ncbi:MAG TPA: Rid family detoxifying hydrolase [candidate division Zixibacteria bacterium]|nr:Rid family detoxifying hydrolase [candidate division Zixibacteria bacterium]
MKEVIKTQNAPAAIGPYSQAIRASGETMLFCSGQIALDPVGGNLVGTNAAQQARQVLNNLKAVIEAASGNLSQVVKTTIYLSDINDFSAVNEVYAEFFDNRPPARAAVAAAALPKGAKVMIEAIAVLG